MKTIVSVGGARPNFMKLGPFHNALTPYRDRIRHLIVHTGQHYDESMSKVFFDEFGLPAPDFSLGVGSGTHGQQTAKIMVEFEKVLEKMRPDLVVVVGDVNSTLACSIASVKLGVPVAHIEAGLRSFDRTMPEEINRVLTDAISDYLFVTEPSAIANLIKEGVDESRIFYVGNVMVDSLLAYRDHSAASNIIENLGLNGEAYVLVTLHRPTNVDTSEGLNTIAEIFERVSHDRAIVFPLHPRTRKMIGEYGLGKRFERIARLKVIEPVGYLDFLKLMENSTLVLTDSGGIQEETTVLGIPCLTLRSNTERPITVEIGTNRITGLDADRVLAACHDVFEGRFKKGSIPHLWDGKAAERIAGILVNKCLGE
ncbi:MAG: UDP-N-acetylglucosamine 2-epimerase (non-hydrolyzing) [Ignavibacteria bacterium]|nr:UDP-N-acetylglucosamine 2-epimerase (non-hydrolyzing) [Ignavibacteria bacterium]